MQWSSALCWDKVTQPGKHPPGTNATGSSSVAAAAGINLGGDPLLLARRCTNCETTSTPLWRNGPRGPKYNASIELSRKGFITVPSFLIQENHADKSELANWFDRHLLDKETGKVVVKPTRSGSSIGVAVAYGVNDSLLKASDIILEGIDDKVLIEVFLEGGSEFTAVVIDAGADSQCEPVSLLPTEVFSVTYEDLSFPTDCIALPMLIQ